MAIELSEFWTRLVRCGITHAQGCQSIAQRYRQAGDGSPPRDAARLAEFMIATGELTPFQRDCVFADPPTPLAVGPFVILDPQGPSPFKKFARARSGAVEGILLRTGIGNQWLDRHLQVQNDSLQSYQAEIVGEHAVVFSPLPQGDLLRNRLSSLGLGDENQKSVQLACQWGKQIAGALSAMHVGSLIHGGVRSDRVWVPDQPSEQQSEQGTKQGSSLLLRDPSGPPSGNDGWLEDLDEKEHSLAPESVAALAAGQTIELDKRTDLYALGCLLYRIATGRPLTEHGGAAESGKPSELPTEVSRAIKDGEAGDPFFRVLAYALASDPEARFADLGQFASALSVVEGLLEPAVASKVAPVAIAPGKPAESKPAEPKPAEPKPAESKLTDSNPTKAKTQSKPETEVQRERLRKPAPVESPDQQPDPQPEPLPESHPDPVRSIRARKPKRRSVAPWVLAGLASVVLFQIAYLSLVDPVQPIVRRMRNRPPLPAVIPSVSSRAAAITKTKASTQADSLASTAGAKAETYRVVQDARLLYVPPYKMEGETAPLDMLPPGPAMIVWLNLDVGDGGENIASIVRRLAPELAVILERAVARVQVPEDRLSRIAAAFHPGQGGVPEVTMAVELREQFSRSELAKQFDVSQTRTKDGMTIYLGDDLDGEAFYFETSESGSDLVSRFTLGSVDQISQVAAIEGQAIPLPRAVKSLWKATRLSCDVCVLMNSNFLFADGRELLTKSAPELVRPLRRLLIPKSSAVLLMVNAQRNGSPTYAEWRMAASGSTTEASLSRTMQESVQQWPSWAQDFVAATEMDDSWSALGQRLPAMISFVSEQVRVGVSDRTATANVYLPSEAVSQVGLATFLAMNTPFGQKQSIDDAANMPEALTMDEILELPLTVSFARESLEAAMEIVADAVQNRLPEGVSAPTIEILGRDLQKLGITQNQPISDFRKTDAPLRAILTDLAILGNPDKSSPGPLDDRQALIWVTEKMAEDSDSTVRLKIVITTRQAVQKPESEARYEVPAEFVAP